MIKPSSYKRYDVFELKAIGTVHNEVSDLSYMNWHETESEIMVYPQFAAGLTGIGHFSHITVLYYLHRTSFDKDSEIVREPFHDEHLPALGVFARRAKERPNPVGLTTVRLLAVAPAAVTVRGLDAVDGTPVLDLKPYNPFYDTVTDAHAPDWVEHHPELFL